LAWPARSNFTRAYLFLQKVRFNVFILFESHHVLKSIHPLSSHIFIFFICDRKICFCGSNARDFTFYQCTQFKFGLTQTRERDRDFLSPSSATSPRGFIRKNRIFGAKSRGREGKEKEMIPTCISHNRKKGASFNSVLNISELIRLTRNQPVPTVLVMYYIQRNRTCTIAKTLGIDSA